MGTQESHGEPKAQEALEAFKAYHGALQMQPGTGPLDEQTLVLTVHRPFGPVGAYSRQSQERIECDAAQGPGMALEAEIPLREQGVCRQWQPERTRCGEHC